MKDIEGISKLADEMKHTEKEMYEIFNHLFLTKGSKIEEWYIKEHFNFFPIPGKDDHKDFFLGKHLGNNLGTFEYEYGMDQRHCWDKKMPTVKDWPRGLSIPHRKKSKNFHFYIKSSPTYSSAFIIYVVDDFLEKFYIDFLNKSSLSDKIMVDNNLFWQIPWIDNEKHKDVLNNEFIIEKKYNNYNIIKNGNICFIEDDNWDKALLFIYHKHLLPVWYTDNPELQYNYSCK